jgi:hypothetical protein
VRNLGTAAGTSPPPDLQLDDLAEKARAEAVRQHQETLHLLLVYSGVALAITTVLALLLGWLMAGRILNPLRTFPGPRGGLDLEVTFVGVAESVAERRVPGESLAQH